MFSRESSFLYHHWHRCCRKADAAAMDAMSDTEAAEAFQRLPAFGTGGIRKKMGIGPNRINEITIGWVTAALTAVLQEKHAGEALNRGVLIAYDTRRHSADFAAAAAEVLAAAGIPTVTLAEPMPVPLLSFVLRREDYLCGIMITASHNPGSDNGIKIYNSRGGQLIPAEAAPIEEKLGNIDPFTVARCPRSCGEAAGLIRYSGKAEAAAYLSALCTAKAPAKLTIVATPLHGAAKMLLPQALGRCGHRVLSVPEQEITDGTFATVAAPNPEDPDVFVLAKEYAGKAGADLILATDGDGDRCGCCIPRGKDYAPLNGNETAMLLLSYLLEREKAHLPKDGYILRTNVSTTLGDGIAAAYGLKTYTTPTGFKYIGAALDDPAKGTFFAGYEESGGFLFQDHTADKDGIATAVLLAEAAAAAKAKGRSLEEEQKALYRRYGYEYTDTKSFGFEEEEQLKACMKTLAALEREGIKKEVTATTVTFLFPHQSKTTLRLSGTEPKLKLYYQIPARNHAEAKEREQQLDAVFLPIIGGFLP